MRGWKNFKVKVTYTSLFGSKVMEVDSIVTIRATHRSMALYVAKRDYSNATSFQIVE